jgi:Tol biopolymer transport system component
MNLNRLKKLIVMLVSLFLFAVILGVVRQKPPPEDEGSLPMYAVADVEVDSSLSRDGSIIAFCSVSDGIVPGDHNGRFDIFVYEAGAKSLSRISQPAGGGESNGDSFSPRVSGDGRFVVFESEASNLVPGDTNNACDVFLYDRQKKGMTRISCNEKGEEGDRASGCPSISFHGEFVAFSSQATNLVEKDTNRLKDVFVKNVKNGRVERVSVDSGGRQGESEEAGNASDDTAISADGRFVAFSSPAANLVEGDTNGFPDIFVRDRQQGATIRASVDSSGGQADNFSHSPALCADGRMVVFDSLASNLAPGIGSRTFNVFARDLTAGTTTLVSRTPSGVSANGESQCPDVDGAGHAVVYSSLATDIAGPPAGGLNVYLYDVKSGGNRLVSHGGRVGEMAHSGNPKLSGDGRYVAYYATRVMPREGRKSPVFQIVLAGTRDESRVVISNPSKMGE